MRSILVLGLLAALVGSANAASVKHPSHASARPDQGVTASNPASGFAYAPSGPAMQYRPAPEGAGGEAYFGASEGYAPGEKERFLNSVRRGG